MGLENITIGTAKWLTTKNNLQGCMIVVFEDGQMKAVSYGADRPKCRQLANLVESTASLVESGAVRMTTFDSLPSFLTQD